MKCPRDNKTTLIKSDDYLDFCPHCYHETYAYRRAINDMVKNRDNLWDYSLSHEKFLEQFGEGFRGLAEAAWNRRQKTT